MGTYSLETIPTEALSLATQSLISRDKSGKPQPSLTSHWTVSEDGKTYVIFLKDNLKWHDSTSVIARDISIAITNVQISALNNQAIQFVLPNPVSSFLLALDKPVFKAKSFYGTGTFRIVDIDQIEGAVKRIKLVPNDPNMPKVEVKFYPTEDQALLALKIGEIKVAKIADAKEVEQWPNVNVERVVGDDEIVTIFFNNEDALFSSKELRQSLIHAINRSEFDGQSATGPISQSSWAYNNTVKRYEYNTGRAKELLTKSQISSPKVKLSYNPSLIKVAQQVKGDWDAIGVETELVAEPHVPQNYQALLTINKLPPDPDQYALWHQSQKQTNITRLKDVKIDKLLEDARTTQDEKVRKDLYFEFQRFLVDEAPAAFLYYPYKYQVTYKNIQTLSNKLPK